MRVPGFFSSGFTHTPEIRHNTRRSSLTGGGFHGSTATARSVYSTFGGTTRVPPRAQSTEGRTTMIGTTLNHYRIEEKIGGGEI